MGSTPDSFFSLVPSGSDHEVEGEREVMLPGISLEILTTRKIRLSRWNLNGLSDPYWRLYSPTSGSALAKHEDTELTLRPGSLYLIPPRTSFSTHNPEPFTKWYVHFVLGRIDRLSLPGIYEQPIDERSAECLARLESRTTGFAWESTDLVVHALSRLPSEAWTDRRFDHRVEKVMSFLQTNLSQKISADDAARVAGVSIRNLNHLFRTQARVSPMGALLNFRLDRACHLLRHTEETIEHIAESCGFPNRYYFSRMLKQHRGISPAAYRKGELY